jgi:hypothetical protein
MNFRNKLILESDQTSIKEVICIINSRANLTIGRTYIIEDYNKDYEIISYTIKNDFGYVVNYTKDRFISKFEFRNKKIDYLFKDDIN